MATKKNITVNGVLTPVWQTDATAQQIDDAVVAAQNAVLYTAQSKTAAEQAQARGNIGAAPSGYGYGGKSTGITFWDDTDGSKLKTHLENMYADYGDTIIRTKLLDYPICKVAGNGGWADIYFGNDPNVKTIIVRFHAVNQSIIGPSVATLMCKDDVWGEWEYENPPMQLGVEYRTTERYLGKPVYVRLVNFGALGNTTTKSVDVAIENVDKIPVLGGTASEVPLIPGSYNGAISGISATRTSAKITISITTAADLSWMQAEVLLGYTKTTD